MTDHSELMILAVVLVAFIAGYSVVSYVVRKFKVGQLHATLDDQSQKGSDPTTDKRSLKEDLFRELERTGRRQKNSNTRHKAVAAVSTFSLLLVLGFLFYRQSDLVRKWF